MVQVRTKHLHNLQLVHFTSPVQQPILSLTFVELLEDPLEYGQWDCALRSSEDKSIKRAWRVGSHSSRGNSGHQLGRLVDNQRVYGYVETTKRLTAVSTRQHLADEVQYFNDCNNQRPKYNRSQGAPCSFGKGPTCRALGFVIKVPPAEGTTSNSSKDNTCDDLGWSEQI